MTELAEKFLDLHNQDSPLLIPNPWDAGSARLLQSLGFDALATTSSGFAATLGRRDYGVTREEAIAHGAQIAAAVDIPVSADLENGFSPEPEEVAETVRRAIGAGLAGCSIEDSTGDKDGPIYCLEHAVARIRAAAEVANDGGLNIVLTARAENHLWDAHDLDDTITRLEAYAEAGAHVLYAPGLTAIEDIRRVVLAVGKPVNVLALPDAPTVSELADAGVARISVGGSFFFAGLGAVVEAATELRDNGTYGWWDRSKAGSKAARAAFS